MSCESKGPQEGADAGGFRSYFDGLSCYVTVQDRDLRILAANERVREAFGELENPSDSGIAMELGEGSDQGPSGKRCYELYKHTQRECTECPVRQTFLEGVSQQGEEVLRSADGVEFPVAVYTAPIRDEHGSISTVLKISADITGVKKLQRRLHKTQRRFQQLFNEVPCYITVQDRDLNITAANRLFQEDFGDELGTKCYELYKHRTEACLHCPVVKTFQDGRSHRSEEVVTSLGGERYHVLVQTQPLRDEQGEITHVLEMSTNITELRQLQDQLTSLGLLVGSISHNLKGLITALDGGMYLVNSGFKRQDSNRLAEGWDIVQRNIGRIRAMVLDILHYAKDRALEPETVDVADFVEELRTLLQAKANAMEIEFEVLVDPRAGQFLADANALRSALINIVENAFDACRVDMKKDLHRVRLEVDVTEEEVRFSVQDNGIGMDRETRERLFSLFFSSKGAEGTGLGLFISAKIVAQHEGSIDVTSSLDVGTRMVVCIPRKGSRHDA